MVKTIVEAGICGFVTEIEAYSEDNQHVNIKINTNCKNISKISERISTVDAYNEIKECFEGEIYSIIKQELRGCCTGCAVPSGIFKSMLVASMLALPKDVKMQITKDD